jgi:hypothetical protein
MTVEEFHNAIAELDSCSVVVLSRLTDAERTARHVHARHQEHQSERSR